MATAYAAFTSLMHLISDLQQHPHPPIQLDEEHIVSINSVICFFLRFLEAHHNTIDHGMEILMADAAHTAEDLIETHIADRVLDESDFNGSLQRVIEGFDTLKKEVEKINQSGPRRQCNDQPRQHPRPIASSPSPTADTSGGNEAVGIEEIATKIVDKLTSQHKSGRQIISITGMGGIGKTTLACKVYNNSCVKDYFDIRAWTTISKDYNSQESLIEILHCLDKTESKESLRNKNEHQLGEQMYKCLIGRRYLVILDDLWDVEAWDRVRSFFPATKGSGIVITTRESSVGSISSHGFGMNLLDEHKSWGLLREKVFGKDSCSHALEKVGKDIARNCRGLPLSIVVIAGHLANSPRTQDYWEYIAQNLSDVVNSEDNERCLKILSLSYNHLPVHLKPCFLYMAIYPEDGNIWVHGLIRLWVAEGFQKPVDGKSLEEVAEDYLNDLMSRNLIFLDWSKLMGNLRYCKMHDLLRDLCLKEALKKNFLCIVQKECLNVSNNERRILLHQSSSKVINSFYGTGVLQSPAFLRTLIFDNNDILLRSKVYNKSSLRVLSNISGPLKIERKALAEVIHDLVNLRCLEFSTNNPSKLFNIPPSIVFLWNLQSLVIYADGEVENVEVPSNIWEMSQLRHINAYQFRLPEPPSGSNDILKNLQSAMRILNFSFSEDSVKRLPNIKELDVTYDERFKGTGSFNNIALLENLELFSCSFDDIALLEDLRSFHCSMYNVSSSTTRNGMLSNLTLPLSLKRLIISNLKWDDVTAKIGSLPLLEMLVLSSCSGKEWELVEGQFGHLKWLRLFRCPDLEYFTADNSHFPCLRRLDLGYMNCLKEIYSGIGDIPTLREIVLGDCADSAIQSAKEVAEYQYQMANEDLQVKALVRKKYSLYAESMSTSNFHVEVH